MFLNEEPHRELEVLPRSAGQLFELGDKKARGLGFETPPSVEHLENGEAHQLFDLEIGFRLSALRNEAPFLLPVLTMDRIVPRTSFRIAQDRVRFCDRAELRRIA